MLVNALHSTPWLPHLSLLTLGKTATAHGRSNNTDLSDLTREIRLFLAPRSVATQLSYAGYDALSYLGLTSDVLAYEREWLMEWFPGVGQDLGWAEYDQALSVDESQWTV